MKKLNNFGSFANMLIFLDIDGVMVPAAGWKRPENLADGFPMFTGKATEALKSLISANAKVVLTTSHRERFSIQQWKEIFERRGIRIENLSSLEPNRNLEKRRKDEIMGWFDKNSVDDNFLIIDDDKSLNALPGHLKQHLILTSPLVGLTSQHIAEAQNLVA